MAFEIVETFDLLFAHLGVVDFQNVDGIFVVKTIFVDAHDGLTAGVDTGLCSCRGFLDAQFGQTGFDGLGHAAEFFDLLNVLPCTMCDLVGESFDIV